MPLESYDFCYVVSEAPLKGFLPGVTLATVKIGSTSNPIQRLLKLRTVWPFAELWHVWFSKNDALRLERIIQRYYRPARLGGEVFQIEGYELTWLFSKAASYFESSETFGEICDEHYLKKWEFCPPTIQGDSGVIYMGCDFLYAQHHCQMRDPYLAKQLFSIPHEAD